MYIFHLVSFHISYDTFSICLFLTALLRWLSNHALSDIQASMDDITHVNSDFIRDHSTFISRSFI